MGAIVHRAGIRNLAGDIRFALLVVAIQIDRQRVAVVIIFLVAHIATRPTAEWLTKLEAADYWCAPVMEWNELLEHDGFKVLDFLQDVLHKEYLDVLEKEITKAFVYSYQEQAESLFQNYLDHAEAYVNKPKVRDRNTKEELQPDEGFLKSIEEQIAIIGSAAEGFRQEVIAYLWAATRRGEKISYRSYEPLKEAIEKKLMTSVRDISRIITKARTRDEEQTGKYESMVQNLLDNGYCESCVDVVLKYAANNLWKD